LRVVRDLTVFEKQKDRIEKFDKLILQYVQQKEKEYLTD